MRSVITLFLIACLSAAQSARAVDIDTVVVGNPGNLPITAAGGQYGDVDYVYRIGRTEVTNAQYVEFLNGVDPTGGNAFFLYHSEMTTDVVGGINFDAGASDGGKYSVKTGRDNYPVNYVNWLNAIRFTNWLHNGQGNSSTETGAYTLLGAGGNYMTVTRNPGANWWIPSLDEWVKAAYHKNDGVLAHYWQYPTSSDTIPFSDEPPGDDAPEQSNTANFTRTDSLANGYNDGSAVGGPLFLSQVGAYTSSVSPYGTYDQGGNVAEWIEDFAPGNPSPGETRGLVGGAYNGSFVGLGRTASPGTLSAGEIGDNFGFRVAAAIPEPTGMAMFTIVVFVAACSARSSRCRGRVSD
jgi:formylglycine-generating enzyme